MSYKIIQPPFTLKFREMEKKELHAYRQWFQEIAPERVTELTQTVNGTTGFETWEPDETPESLDRLGEWFSNQVETRKRTDEEILEMEARLTFPIEIPDDELTNRSFSLAMDIAMYFARVVLRNLPGTHWDQPMKRRNDADYGQPVIVGLGTVPMNPVRLIVTLAYAFAEREQTGSRLREIFEYWSKRGK